MEIKENDEQADNKHSHIIVDGSRRPIPAYNHEQPLKIPENYSSKPLLSAGLILIILGIAILIGGWILMESMGMGGIILGPFIYIVGPGLFLTGMYKLFSNGQKNSLKQNIIIVSTLIFMVIAAVLLVVLQIERREDQCRAAYGSFTPEYKTCRANLF